MARTAQKIIDTSAYQNIPLEMRERKQWVCYTLEPGKDNRITKIPREPKTGARAKINEPSGAWCTFDEALERIHRYDGLEYMLTADDPFTFIDLDHCIDETTSKPQEWAQRIINRFDSYTELSQSGSGIHIIGRGSKPGQRCRTSKQPGIELYDHSRPIVMTGKVVQGKTTIEACGNEISGLYSDLFANEEAVANEAASRLPLDVDHTPASASAPAGGDISDAELIEKAMASPKSGAAFTLLWNGNTAEYAGDDSAADQALCNHLAWWTNSDPDRMDRLFRQSGLMRDKWNRTDYRDRTISLAIRDTRGGYTGGSRSRSAKSNSKNKDAKSKRPSPTSTGEVEFTPELKHLTDLGNAEYLIDRYGDNLRFNVDSKTWLHWTGTKWQSDNTGEIERVTREAIRSLYDILKETTDPDKSRALFAHIKKSESRPRLEATVALARYCSGIPIQAHDLDADQWLFNCPNGTVDLRTGELQPHRQSDLIAKIAGVDYDPDAKCPRWLQFLDEIFMGDQELVGFARRFIGYCLTGDTREESVFILYGRGQCGKSKFLDTIRYIIGDYIRDTPVTTFTERNDTNTADLASLVGARLVTASEAEENQAFNEPLLKRISGRDPITCRHLYQNFFTYIPTFKVVVATNDVPRIKSQGFAMKR
ncbi:MAG: phage/plasmid primase, P4 family, partial [Armatimonadota bacterium]